MSNSSSFKVQGVTLQTTDNGGSGPGRSHINSPPKDHSINGSSLSETLRSRIESIVSSGDEIHVLDNIVMNNNDTTMDTTMEDNESLNSSFATNLENDSFISSPGNTNRLLGNYPPGFTPGKSTIHKTVGHGSSSGGVGGMNQGSSNVSSLGTSPTGGGGIGGGRQFLVSVPFAFLFVGSRRGT